MSTPALSRAAVDRAAEHRRDQEWLASAWASGRLLVLDEQGRAMVDDDTGLVLVDTASYRGGAYDGERFLLGLDGDVAVWAGVGELPRKLGARPASLRDVGAVLPDRDAGLLVTAVALANWHATHTRCPRCGAPTRVVDAGWVRRCDADGSDHFPRTDPAIIVLVHDGGDRCLLGRQPSWPPGRYSTLAGFVEPGEALEHAVIREVHEEASVVVGDVVYRGSQPWPFPASLMLGFEARVVSGEAKVSDGELEDVRWFTRDELRQRNTGIPPSASIAYWLITTWLDRD
ncbi:MAG TPA: NAD(+) diphosphatase [Mycobacteriales bacterium]|nr:NAD(+) diphosphatase [Mycobacteriales bacterium]